MHVPASPATQGLQTHRYSGSRSPKESVKEGQRSRPWEAHPTEACKKLEGIWTMHGINHSYPSPAALSRTLGFKPQESISLLSGEKKKKSLLSWYSKDHLKNHFQKLITRAGLQSEESIPFATSTERGGRNRAASPWVLSFIYTDISK